MKTNIGRYCEESAAIMPPSTTPGRIFADSSLSTKCAKTWLGNTTLLHLIALGRLVSAEGAARGVKKWHDSSGGPKLNAGTKRWNVISFLLHVHDTKADRKTADNHDSSSLVLVLQYRLVHQSRPKPINPKDEARTHQFCTQVLRGILMRLVECAR